MKFPVTATREYHGKTLDIDCEQETLALFDDKGQRLAIISWETLFEHMLSIDEDSRFAHSRVIRELRSRLKSIAAHRMENNLTA